MRNTNKNLKKSKQQANELAPKLDKKAITAFLKKNPAVDLATLNILKPQSLQKLNWGKQGQETLLPQLRALQRLIRLTKNQEAAEALYESGLHSAIQIAAIPQRKFVKQYATLFTPGDMTAEEQAKQVHQCAVASKSQSVLTYTAIAQHKSPYYQSTRFNNLSATTDSNYNNLPSYQELFGDLDYCSCSECGSIFSPAAYLVDLMRLQDAYIDKDATAQSLEERRPDLWNLVLDCDNTNTLIPKLKIVNEVLLQTLGNGVTDQQLDITNYPFNLPFNLPLSQINLYLGQNKQSLAGIWQSLSPQIDKATQVAIARQSLQLPPAQWKLYSTSQTNVDTIASYYGLTGDAAKDPVNTLASVDTFLTQTGLSYVQLQELVNEDLNNDELGKGLSAAFFINVGEDKPIILQTDENGNEILANLTIQRLDHINRFIRLANGLGWSFTDLDWALRTIGTIVNTANKNAPVINDEALLYVAWFQLLKQQYKLSINQCCALIGMIKDLGQQNGPTFFDQIFNSAAVPNPPSWQDQNGNYSLNWNVSKPDSQTTPAEQDVQIQDALSAALQISQDDLLRIAQLLLQALGIQDNQLPLSLQNLSILYRLSKLQALTSLSIQECVTALQLPGQPQDAWLNLASADGTVAQSTLLSLQQFAQWLKNSPFSVYQLQFILTGTSQDPTIQNQILGADQIANFLRELQTAIQPTLLTEESFSMYLCSSLQATLGNQAEEVANAIWEQLQSQGTNYISEQGIITKKGAAATTEDIQQLLAQMQPPITIPTESIDLIVSILQSSYQLQQKTLTQQLAGLYGVSPSLVPVLMVWGGLTWGDVAVPPTQKLTQENAYAGTALLQSLLAKPASSTSVLLLQADEQGTVVRLQVLQQYAFLLNSLSLSAAEAQAMIDYPDCFGISYQPGKTSGMIPQFTLANIQTLYRFKQLIQTFQDTGNHMLDYLEVASSNPSLDEAATALSNLTQWDTDQIQFLFQKLWPSQEEAGAAISGYATIAGLDQLAKYFKLAQQLYIDIVTLWQLVCAADVSTAYTTLQRLANAIWAGLQKQFQNQPSQLDTLQGTVDELRRNALIGLVIYQLRTKKGLPIMTPNDLYEYLLIDVEVSEAVQTSYVQEAISALQLYIYRCMNHFEAGVEVQDDMYTWWPWMEHYRVWEANREVFLYPENYIQPELRKDKTPQFTQLENDLQQNKLTAESVDTAVKTYIDGFAQVATLKIVGSCSYTNDDTAEKTLYFVGRTNTQAYTYYYRTATFTLQKGKYVATQWTPWIEIDLQIKSTVVTPLYAFDKLFLFWAEAKQGQSDQDEQGKSTGKRFETTLYYSFYDFNQQWTAAQQLLGPILLPPDVNTQTAAEDIVWQEVRTVFDTETQLIGWNWGEGDTVYPIYQGTINSQLDMLDVQITLQHLTNLDISESPNLVVYQDKLYCFHQGKGNNKELRYSIFDGSKWQSDKKVDNVGISTSPSTVIHQGMLYCFYRGQSDKGEIWYSILDGSKWKATKNMHPYSIYISASPSAVVYQDKLYFFYQGSSENDDKLWYARLDAFSQPTDPITVDYQLPYATGILESPSAVVYQNKLYCFHQGLTTKQLLYSIWDGKTWQKEKSIPSALMTGSPSAVVFHNKLYCFYQSTRNNTPTEELWYATLDERGVWRTSKLNISGPIASPSLAVYQDKLYCFYRTGNKSSKVAYVTLNDTNLALASPWAIELGPDGTQFLVNPAPASANQRYVRLNSMVVQQLSKILFSQGISRLLALSTQKTPEIKIDGTKTETLDFAGANGLYYWELFFQLPFLVAHSFSIQQQFELAQQWYAYIFNPTVAKKDWELVSNEDPNDKYWRFLQLRSQYNPTLQTELGETWAEEVQQDMQDATQLAAYHNDPFDPHAIASLRPIAYQKTIVMHYIDNLLAWADNLFRQYTAESILEATMYYVVAYDLLGKQPTNLGACALPDPETLSELVAQYGSLDKIPEFLIYIEQAQSQVLVTNVQDIPHNYIADTYFVLPENEQFMAYWDKIAQRLYNIRHSLNIDGVYQQVALFQPPIDPMQLVAAVASGEGTSQALASNQVSVPYYRFSVMVMKAQAITQAVIQLGQSLLSVLEKQDAEQLSLLYNTNQQNLLALTRTSKQDQLEASTQNVQALQASLQNATDRYDHYTQLLTNGLSTGEQAQIALDATAISLQISAQAVKGAAVAGYLTPTIYGFSMGGMNPGDAIMQGANTLEGSGNATSMSANLAGTMANYLRREEDWQLQQTLAQDDINQLQCQILAAQYQERIAQEDISLLEKQIEQEQDVEDFLKNKFTRSQLYQWMVGKISTLYFQAYQIAYDLAIQAEKAWQFERCKQQTFISPAYWDDLYHGLTAGEALQLDLQRMEKAYMDQDVRKLEIEKVISLAQLDPQALQNLRATGTCSFDLAEQDFDYDYRGHYCRQIKSISLSFPALLGPYQNAHATLTQTANKTLIQPDEQGVKYLLGIKDENGNQPSQPDSSILQVNTRANQQVALSQGANDSGLFVLNFDDPRYLPFEGTGAISSWNLDMPKDCNPIDFDSLTDVVIRLQYTALSGGKAFQDTVKQNLSSFNGYQTLSMLQYTSAWYSFIQQGNPLQFMVGPSLLRPNLSGYKVIGIALVAKLTEAGEGIAAMPTLTLTPGSATPQDLTLSKQGAQQGTVKASTTFNAGINVSTAANWQITVQADPGKLMTAANVSNMIIGLQYTAKFS